MWGKEIGGYSPQLIIQGMRSLVSAMRTASTSAVNAFGQPNLGFTISSDLLNNRTAMNSLYNTPQLEGASGNTYYIGEGAFNIHVSDMTDQECKSVILQALESL